MKLNIPIIVPILGLFTGFSHPAFGQEPSFLFGGAFTFGGDKLASVDVVFSNGDLDTQDVDAGGFLYFYGGVDIPFQSLGREKSGLALTLGYHTDFVTADNGEVDFSRMPLDFAYYYQPENVGFSFGGTYHLNPKLDIDVDFGQDASIDYDDSLGFFAEVYFAMSPNANFSVRYTVIDYEIGNASVDGNHLGLGLKVALR